VPARKPWGRLQMIHILEQQRPDQTRGISEMVATLKELRITKRFRDIVLQNAVVILGDYRAMTGAEKRPSA
jgi:capsid protein